MISIPKILFLLDMTFNFSRPYSTNSFSISDKNNLTKSFIPMTSRSPEFTFLFDPMTFYIYIKFNQVFHLYIRAATVTNAIPIRIFECKYLYWRVLYL